MSSSTGARARPERTIEACGTCTRRSWLLGELSGPLDYCARERQRLLELLALPDRQLLDAVAGRRAAELRARYERFTPSEVSRAQDAQAICRHARGYPTLLERPGAPHMLEVSGGTRRLRALSARPVVALLGSAAASDYGMEIARTLARGLAASEVTVAAGFSDGIAVAAHSGALDAPGAGSVAVLGGGLEVSCPARRIALRRRVTREGCVVCELPPRVSGRRWGALAAERIVVGLAVLTVLVEGEATERALYGAGIARALGRPLAAIPGRVSSPLSRAPHRLLMEGASLVRGPEDVLELLHRQGSPQPRAGAAPGRQPSDPTVGLRGELRAILEHVGCGCDTPDKLTRAGVQATEALLGLSELEIAGLLGRGDGGRYLLRHPCSPAG